jgi:hypothetical protein
MSEHGARMRTCKDFKTARAMAVGIATACTKFTDMTGLTHIQRGELREARDNLVYLQGQYAACLVGNWRRNFIYTTVKAERNKALKAIEKKLNIRPAQAIELLVAARTQEQF